MTTDTDTFTYERELNAASGTVWTLMTDPGKRAIWGAPDESVALTTLKADFRVGGTDRQRFGSEEEPEFEAETRWYNIAEGEAATYTEVIEAGGMALGASLVTFALSEAGSGTKLAIIVAVSSFVGPEMIAEFRAGWDSGFEQISALANQSN